MRNMSFVSRTLDENEKMKYYIYFEGRAFCIERLILSKDKPEVLSRQGFRLLRKFKEYGLYRQYMWIRAESFEKIKNICDDLKNI
jgi:hypothetical protein